MKIDRSYMFLWYIQLISNLFILGMGIANLVLVIFFDRPEAFILFGAFMIIYFKGEREGTGIRSLIRDKKDFKEKFICNEEINKRYSLKKKKFISERKVRKEKERREIIIIQQRT